MGAINGVLIAYVGVPPFVVTLGMLSIARSLAMVLSDNRMVYQFGPDQPQLLALGGGFVDLPLPLLAAVRIPNPVIVLLVLLRRRRARVPLDALGPAPVRHRRQRRRGDADRGAGEGDQGQRLHVLQPHRGNRRHPRGRLARHDHDRARAGDGVDR